MTIISMMVEGGLEVILDDIYEHLGRFVAYPSNHAHVAQSLWVVHAHCVDAFDSTPRIAFLSPEPGSGKTRCLEAMEPMLPNPIMVSNASASSLYRTLQAGRAEGNVPVILYDEIDGLFGTKIASERNDDVRTLINDGHRKGKFVTRWLAARREVERIPTYSAVGVAGLGNIPQTLIQRSIVVRMKKRSPNEYVEPYRERLNRPQGEEIGKRIESWARNPAIFKRLQGIIDRGVNFPPGVNDRDADCWEPLLAVAELSGAKWANKAREAAEYLVRVGKAINPSLEVRIITDIRKVLTGWQAEMVPTAWLIDKLLTHPESPWANLKYGPLNDKGLARMLRKFDIHSKVFRLDEITTPRGYSFRELQDTWERYSPPEEQPKPEATGTDGEGCG